MRLLKASLRSLLVVVVLLASSGVLLPSAHAAYSPFLESRIGPPGMDTGLDLTADYNWSITAAGRAGYGLEGSADCPGYPQTDPDGQRYLNGGTCGPKIDPQAVDPGEPIGKLMGRVGDGGWFPIGSSTSVTPYDGGRLYLLYNDTDWSDNTGGYEVTVTLLPSTQLGIYFVGPDVTDPVSIGKTITYTAQVWNEGYSTATGVAYGASLPKGMRLKSVTSSKANRCTTSAGLDGSTQVSCPLGTMVPTTDYTGATVTLVVSPRVPGSYRVDAWVTGNEPDPDPRNNDTRVYTVVTRPKG